MTHRIHQSLALAVTLAVIPLAHADEGDEAAAVQATSIAKIDKRVQRIERILDNQVMLELLQRVESLQTELRELRGEIESQGFEIESMRKRQRDLYLDSDRRLRDLELTGGGSTQPSTSSSSDLSDSGSSTASSAASLAAAAASASSTASSSTLPSTTVAGSS